LAAAFLAAGFAAGLAATFLTAGLAAAFAAGFFAAGFLAAVAILILLHLRWEKFTLQD
jgi:hypothetical protein